MDNRTLRKTAQKSMQRAMKFFRGPSYVPQPKEVVKFGRYDELSRLQIDQGVIAFVLECNLSGGSVGNVDVYKLMQAYLLDEDARAEINNIILRS